MRFGYRLLAALLAPLYAGWLLWRGRHERGDWRRFGERLGYGPRPEGGGAIWVHAVSVGEVQASQPLVTALRAAFRGHPLVVTTVTATGAARARALFGGEAQVRYLPLDLPGPVQRFLAGVRPRIAIVLETELWPTLYDACAARGVPVVLASARLSERSLRRYRRVGGLIRATLARVVVAAQTEADAARFLALGAAPERTHVTGNVKFDFELAAALVAQGARIRAEQAPGRPVWVAGSTHPGEEAIVLAAHRRVRASLPSALLVLAPRHPDRFRAVAAWLEREGVSAVARSGGGRCGPGSEVLLLDTLGELVAFYAAGDVAFVGGSLVPLGGHNLLEPAALGRPVLAGPWNFNAPQVARLLVGEGAARIVRDAGGLADEVGALLVDAAARERIGALGRAALERNRGALARLLALVTPLLNASAS